MIFGYKQSDLFSLSGVPEWLPDETIFSLCSRYHVLTGNLRASASCHQLFGHAQQGTAHDFPSRLTEFSRRTRGLLGGAEEIIRSRTLLPYYLPFRSIGEQENAIAAMCGTGIGSLKFQLGILTSRFGANHPLKACAECMREDGKIHGSTYWHLSHQYPGAWICLRHNAPLLVSTEKSTGVGRFLWLLPTQKNMRQDFDNVGQDTSNIHALDAMSAIAHGANALARLPDGFNFDAQVLLATYHAALRERGLSTSSGSLKNAAIGTSYFEALTKLTMLRNFVNFPDSPAHASLQVLRLLRVPRSGTHPLRHLLLIYWLFENWEDFWLRYQRKKLTIGAANYETIILPIDEDASLRQDIHAELVRSVKEDGLSVRKAAIHVGIDITTAMAWLAKAGISTPKRPKKIKSVLRQQLVADLERGTDKEIVAATYGVSTSTVMKILRLEVGLYDAWTTARYENTRKNTRGTWLDMCLANPDMGVKRIRGLNPRIYAWLYRNDKVWLALSIKQVAKIPAVSRTNVDWHLRDLRMSADVRRIGWQLKTESPNIKISLWQIYQRLPKLKAKLSCLGRLPLTKKAIDDLTLNERSENKEDLFNDFKNRL